MIFKDFDTSALLSDLYAYGFAYLLLTCAWGTLALGGSIVLLTLVDALEGQLRSWFGVGRTFMSYILERREFHAWQSNVGRFRREQEELYGMLEASEESCERAADLIEGWFQGGGCGMDEVRSLVEELRADSREKVLRQAARGLEGGASA